ncbi:MAG TPA: Lrp/AsnC ligand binding domain-containing protein, partial [Methanothrix sp.]|nr:Lrp/AsnC ligand binding domain-containing protein [Methanothrix sp.]
LLPVGESALVIGLTMIKVSPGQEGSVYAHLQKRPEVRDVYRLFGEYSFFLVVQAEEKNALGRMLCDIKARENVLKTGPVLFSKDRRNDVADVADQATAS